MPLAESPYSEREDEERDAYQRCGVLEPQRRSDRVRLADYGEGGEVADTGKRYSECEQLLEPGAIYCDGVLGGLYAAVGDCVQ